MKSNFGVCIYVGRGGDFVKWLYGFVLTFGYGFQVHLF